MAVTFHRTQVLLEPEQHRALSALARREGRSMSDLLREIVRRELARREQELEAKKRQWLEGLERIEQRKQEMLARRGGKPIDIDVVQLINEARDERIDQILGIDRELSD
ncbi:MAG TPA: ribbon-helix-helix domain-containing protein [Chloroflexota bacterium]|jgi:hypothetical protein|nr:ribbon-helix-helix domain-containing protein [Chloroflexota bacterium]